MLSNKITYFGFKHTGSVKKLIHIPVILFLPILLIMTPDLQSIKKAADGLLFISESDHPFELVHIEDNPSSIENKIMQLAKKPAGTTIEKQDLDYFFRNMVKVYPEFSTAQKNTARRFADLVKVLKENLTDIHVYRVGDVQVDAFIIGQLKNGQYAGLRTKLIET